MILKIESKPKVEMETDAINCFPDECCGFMFGNEDDALRTVTHVLAVNNSKQGDKRRRFEIAPHDYMNAEKYAEEKGLSLLGIYHSHPNHPAIPSETDREAAQGYFSYVIISVIERGSAGMRSWRLNTTAQFEEENII
jgi:proteasome lid subunit RPN8/RPN11